MPEPIEVPKKAASAAPTEAKPAPKLEVPKADAGAMKQMLQKSSAARAAIVDKMKAAGSAVTSMPGKALKAAKKLPSAASGALKNLGAKVTGAPKPPKTPEKPAGSAE